MMPTERELLFERTREWQEERIRESHERRQMRVQDRGGLLHRIARATARMVSMVL